jgi:hypothetical protein
MNPADLHRKAHEAFNARDWAAMSDLVSPEVMYEDQARGITMKSRDEFIDWLKGWAAGMSDATPADPNYMDSGEYSICRFMGRGTNDGPLGPAIATGNRLDLPFCEVLRWRDDKMIGGEIYYDMMTMMVQFGVMEPPPQQ